MNVYNTDCVIPDVRVDIKCDNKEMWFVVGEAG